MSRTWRYPLSIAMGGFAVGCAIPPDIVAVSSASTDSVSESDSDSQKDPGGDLHRNTRSNKLKDACGDVVVLRGVNELADVAADPSGESWLPEIARTGANAVRLRVGGPDNIIPELDTLLTNCENARMAAIVTAADAEGDWSALSRIVDRWVSPEVRSVLEAHKSRSLLDIADAMGSEDVSDDAWVAAYTDIIQRVRAEGLTMPIVIGPPAWGTRARTILERGKDVVAADPQANVVMSIAMRPTDPGTYEGDEVSAVLEGAAGLDFPVLVTAFGPKGRDCSSDVDYGRVLSDADRLAIGWMAWSWGATGNSECPEEDMTDGGSFDTLRDWGRDIVEGPHGLLATASPTRLSTGEGCD